MNKIYALKYDAGAGSLVPVPEFLTGLKKNAGRKRGRILRSVLIFPIIVGAFPVSASIVNGEVPYQVFRDFAENKGQFTPGTMNISIPDKNGGEIGHLDKAPIPDFSPVNVRSNAGVATLISPQYVASVKHNIGYQNVSFGDGKNSYRIVDRNNQPSADFHIPRLNKLVTEVIPVEASNLSQKQILDTSRFPVFYRLGSGTQSVLDGNGKVHQVAGGYSYLTGGTTVFPLFSHGSTGIQGNMGTSISNYKPLGSFGQPGDSGSPLFGWDTTRSKWLFVGVYAAIGGGTNPIWGLIPTDFVAQSMADDNDSPVTYTSGKGPLRWTFDSINGLGSLIQGDTAYIMHGQKDTNPDAGKNLIFAGDNGEIVLEDAVNQGAGSLKFNSNYTVSSANNATWQGAGLDIARAATVTWQINGVKDDNLHKIGEGTLKVNGTGINEGGMKIGDGKVVLAQHPDSDGKIQAFSSVNIASGRPTVVLTDDKQVNPDTISWGFRGGRLDVNGNDILFHQLWAADNGAIISNDSNKSSMVSLDMMPLIQDKDIKIHSMDWHTWKGVPGDLYRQKVLMPDRKTWKTYYYILKKQNYGVPWGESSDSSWEYIGNNETQAREIARQRLLRKEEKRYVTIYHGQFRNNLNISNKVSSGSDRTFISDGGMDIPDGQFIQQNGHLVFQGHPVIHAYNSQSVANKLKSLGDNSVRTQPVSFDQPDWENRTFTLNTLSLNNASFALARNATLQGNIEAVHSAVTLGSPELFIDLSDGNGSRVVPQEGTSVATTEADMSRYNGKVFLRDQSTLNIREIFSGSINGQSSAVTVTSGKALLEGYSLFSHTPLLLESGARLTSSGGWFSNSPVNIGPSASLTLEASPATDSNRNAVIPTFYTTDYGPGFTLQGGSSLTIGPWAFVTGDIQSDGEATASIGDDSNVHLLDNPPLSERLAASLFSGFRNVYGGTVTMSKGRMTMTDTQWQMPGSSRVGTLSVTRSLAGFTGHGGFSTLTVDTLQASQSGFALRTDLQDSDKIVVNQKATGRNNTLFVNFLKKPDNQTSLNIPLVSAPAGTDPTLFRAAERVTGFSLVTPTLHTTEQDGKLQWILDGFKSAPDKGSAMSANSFMGMGYKNFMTEVNNLNKRMGDLRDTQGEDGMWVRIMNGAGTGDAGYSDRYTHLQTGFDKKHRLSGADLFTGILMSYTDSSASGRAYSGDTHSLGGGIYASIMLDSGAYMDVIGKYIHHDNEYSADFAGLGNRSYGTHSWYAGVEGGYRYHVTESLYVEPQAELVYGAVSGTTLKWSDNGMDVSMRSKGYNPLIGRTGVSAGKIFSGKGWSITARAGVDWQFDLVSNGETALRDASGEKQFTGKKDSRMLYHVGLNAQVKDNMRVGLELEQSAFGKYNIDHAINANFRYMF
ncbi:autotransporter outer membrane beta-barrel domain-containing protein [Salmonella enterica subsp. enterica serovar Ball]|nr:autotransporter outer membrane beta-barrel domain-containing protein [Salmonella enterica subsp. enterica serovar Minnesota]ECI4647524.1 autotransporter outer membrane beta-barrel domain-containing protein [Salmonella enterica subsp. salamae]EDV5024228.1 autotransporter outer membrane beta-barrel domain-containing protein [Salmonella enterica subsp. enterica serovar Ball]